MALPEGLRGEADTIAVMIRDDCRRRHGGEDLCPACADQLAYALARLASCRWGAAKPDCARCPRHCYAPARREAMRAVMRAQGPRMAWRHPWLALLHLLRRRRPIPRVQT